eukprot:m.304929 g.304929  ORF g.304929 m.304929 type:complete len:200 (+) comp16443_c1_seq5:202-801(+)
MSHLARFSARRMMKLGVPQVIRCTRFMTTNPNPNPNPNPNTSTEAAPDNTIEELTQRISSLEEEAKQAKTSHLRALADIENLRKRHTAEINDLKLFGIQKFSKDLLEVADVLELAIKNAPAAESKESAELVQKLLLKIFERNGLERIYPENAIFDPNTMEAMFTVADTTKDEGTVSVVTRAGYHLNGRVVRAASVGVVS